MNKSWLLLIALALLMLPLFSSLVKATTLTLTEPTQTFGFQNGSYLGFREDITFTTHYQNPSNATSFPSYIFLVEQGTDELFGFCLGSGVNVTVNSFFDSNILELSCVGAGTIYVQTPSRDAPVSATGASLATYNTITKLVTITVTSSGIVQLNYNVEGGGGSSGGEVTPTTEPTTYPTQLPYETSRPLGEIDFQADNINLGTVNPNSTVIAKMHFRYSGSSYHLQSIIFDQPFNAMYLHDPSFNQLTYIITNNGQGEGTVDLTFNIPSFIPVERFTGGFEVTAIDAFGGLHKSNGEITLIVAGATEEWALIGFFREHPIYMLPIVLVVVAVLSLIVLVSQRKR